MQLLGAKPAPEPCMHWHHDKAPVHISVMSKHHQRLKSGEKKAPRAPSLSRQYPAPPTPRLKPAPTHQIGTKVALTPTARSPGAAATAARRACRRAPS
ncbi:hypothetical protein PUN4_570078 [Paraburkholderia unamae]|nr:hypothetical protein PUN4_570078 [Paraburkholderia unamae]